MDNKRAKKLTTSLRRGNALVNGIGDQFWHELDIPGRLKR